MNKEKQIEEMANEIYETLMLEAECPLSGMDCAIIADLLVKKGYRKASDFAREIFEEIEEALILSKCCGDSGVYFERDIETDIAELKKKYTKEE